MSRSDPEPRSPAQLQAGIADFQGREREFAAVASFWSRSRPRGGPVPVLAVTGAMGIGRTTFAIQVGHRYRDRFPDGQFFVDLSGHDEPAEVGDVLGALLRSVTGAGQRLPPDPAARALTFRRWAAGRAVLMVLDNAVTASQVLPLLPPDGGSAVLVTSPDRLSGLRVGAEIALPSFSRAEATSLLAEVIGPGRAAAEPVAAAMIVRSCGYHPLVVRALAERIRLDRYAGLNGLARYLARIPARALELRHYDPGFWRRVESRYLELDRGTREILDLVGRGPETFDRPALRALLPLADPAAVLRRLIEEGLITGAEPGSGGDGASGRTGPAYRICEPVRLWAATRPALEQRSGTS